MVGMFGSVEKNMFTEDGPDPETELPRPQAVYTANNSLTEQVAKKT